MLEKGGNFLLLLASFFPLHWNLCLRPNSCKHLFVQGSSLAHQESCWNSTIPGNSAGFSAIVVWCRSCIPYWLYGHSQYPWVHLKQEVKWAQDCCSQHESKWHRMACVNVFKLCYPPNREIPSKFPLGSWPGPVFMSQAESCQQSVVSPKNQLGKYYLAKAEI